MIFGGSAKNEVKNEDRRRDCIAVALGVGAGFALEEASVPANHVKEAKFGAASPAGCEPNSANFR